MRGLFARSPVTAALVVLFGGAALLGLLAPEATMEFVRRPWGLVTYPLAVGGLGSPFALISLFFLGMLLLQFGASVEGEMGSARYAAFWGVTVLLFGAIALGLGIPLTGPWAPSAAVLVAWCARNRSARVMLYGILPVSGTWLAGLVVVGMIVGFGGANPINGVAMLVPIGLAWIFASDLTPVPFSAARAARGKMTAVRGAKMYDERYFENVKGREIEREERERLRKLFEGD